MSVKFNPIWSNSARKLNTPPIQFYVPDIQFHTLCLLFFFFSFFNNSFRAVMQFSYKYNFLCIDYANDCQTQQWKCNSTWKLNNGMPQLTWKLTSPAPLPSLDLNPYYLKNTRRPLALRATRRRVLFNFQWPREEETGVAGSGFSNDRRRRRVAMAILIAFTKNEQPPKGLNTQGVPAGI